MGGIRHLFRVEAICGKEDKQRVRTGMIQDEHWRTTMTTQTEWKRLARWVTPRGKGRVQV